MMIFTRIQSLIRAYALYLYGAGFLALLLCWREIGQAQKLRSETIFSLEKELAAVRQRRGRNTLVVVLAFLVLLTALGYAPAPGGALPANPEPTSTLLVIELPTPTLEPPTPTRTRIPTRPRPTALPPTETPTRAPPPTPVCAQPGVCITSPMKNQVIAGQVTIRGTAQIDRFQFYKLEYGMGENPEQWNSIGDIHHSPVVDGALGVWDTAGFPNGVFKLRLTVVDMSGNFPPPAEVRVTIQQ
jgi:hypothetical protein